MLNRQSKTLLAAAICLLCSGAAFAQQGAPMGQPGAGMQAAPAGKTAGNPVMQSVEAPRPQNPLEEMSRLNSEIATLRAKLALTDIKAQIKKKEEEMLPPKVEKAAPVAKKEERTMSLPPLPNLNQLPKPLDLDIGKPAAGPKPPMEPQLVAIEGEGDDLYAEIQTDWGGFAKVRPGDSYHEYKITEITPNYVRAKNGKGQPVQLAMRTAGVQRLQAVAAMPATATGMGGLGMPPMPMTSPSMSYPAPMATPSPFGGPEGMAAPNVTSSPIRTPPSPAFKGK